jgi:serine/threonine-protein kinase SRPK3
MSHSFFPFSSELCNISKLCYWLLPTMPHDKYLLPCSHADLIMSFLSPVLHLHSDQRAKASELVHHPWLDSIVVLGEIDMRQ